MIYNFKTEDIEQIVKAFGNDFFSDTSIVLESLIIKWHIENLQLVNSFSSNLVFKGLSQIHGPIIMKFGRNFEEFISEVNALKCLSGPSVCKLYEVDFEHYVILEEAILPGVELTLENQIEKRLNTFCDLYLQLHVINNESANRAQPFNQAFKYKSYKDWIFRITDYMEAQECWGDVTEHMKFAKALFVKLTQDYSAETLLHGDLHYHNILRSENGYRIIDPKGVIGDPIFDIPRYMLNEFWDQADPLKLDESIETVFKIISCKLNIPRSVLSKLLYIEGALAICWHIEDGASLDEKDRFIATLDKLRMYMSL